MRLFKRKKSGGADTSSLHNEKQKADIIINSIDDGVVLVDKKNIVNMFNPAATKITGWTKEESLGLDFRSILRFVDEKGQPINDDQNAVCVVLQSGESLRDDDAILVKKDNKQLYVDISVSPMHDSKGELLGAAAIIRDVESQRREAKQHADFISTASHEMRTPVAAIEGYLALALNEKVSKIDSNARSYLEKAHSSTSHLGKLFQDLLTSSKAEDGRLTSHPEVVEMGDFIEKLVDDLRFSAENKGLRLELLVGSGRDAESSAIDVNKKIIRPLLYAYVDPDRLREAITNLFDNAVKYTESGKISVGITGDKSVVQFHISDTGAGISKADIPHLFQKFYRIDNTSTRTIGGTGLGLFICKKIIELYNGQIWVDSEEGKGSTFYINLPRLDSSKAAVKEEN